MPSCKMREAMCPGEAVWSILLYEVSDEGGPLTPVATWPQLQ